MPPQGRAERAVLVLFGELVPELVVELEAVKLLGQLELGGMMSVQTGAPIIPGARAPLHLHKKSAERKMERVKQTAYLSLLDDDLLRQLELEQQGLDGVDDHLVLGAEII